MYFTLLQIHIVFVQSAPRQRCKHQYHQCQCVARPYLFTSVPHTGVLHDLDGFREQLPKH